MEYKIILYSISSNKLAMSTGFEVLYWQILINVDWNLSVQNTMYLWHVCLPAQPSAAAGHGSALGGNLDFLFSLTGYLLHWIPVLLPALGWWITKKGQKGKKSWTIFCVLLLEHEYSYIILIFSYSTSPADKYISSNKIPYVLLFPKWKTENYCIIL